MPKKAVKDMAGRSSAGIPGERGLAMRILLYSPKDMIAGLLAFAACTAVIANALFLQRGPHPAPMFSPAAASPTVPASPVPRPRPAEADASSSEPRLVEPKLAEPKLIEQRPPDSMANLVKATATSPLSSIPMAPPPPSIVGRPPAPIPPVSVPTTGARRLAAVQRALADYGYGQLKPTGIMNPETQAAIQKFERERRLPVTGQVSERLVHELTAAIGHAPE